MISGFGFLRNRNSPRPITGVLRVRERLEAVETPLKSMKKSKKARQKPFRSAMPSPFCPCLLDSRPNSMMRQVFVPALPDAAFLSGLDTPILISRNPSPLRSMSSSFIVGVPFLAYESLLCGRFGQRRGGWRRFPAQDRYRRRGKGLVGIGQ